MSFATGEDVMRTVETIVSDLTRSLDSDFCAVKKGEDVYLAPRKSLVCRSLVFHTITFCSDEPAETNRPGRCFYGLTLLQAPLSSYVI